MRACHTAPATVLPAAAVRWCTAVSGHRPSMARACPMPRTGSTGTHPSAVTTDEDGIRRSTATTADPPPRRHTACAGRRLAREGSPGRHRLPRCGRRLRCAVAPGVRQPHGGRTGGGYSIAFLLVPDRHGTAADCAERSLRESAAPCTAARAPPRRSCQGCRPGVNPDLRVALGLHGHRGHSRSSRRVLGAVAPGGLGLERYLPGGTGLHAFVDQLGLCVQPPRSRITRAR